jgi:hypothetical protein
MVVLATYVSEDIETAYFRAVDFAEEVADRIAFLSLAGVEIGVITVTYPTADVDALFEIAAPVPDAHRSAVNITSEDFAQIDRSRSESQDRAVRLFRTGVSSPSPYHAVAQFWAAAEVIAEERAKADEAYNEHRCAKCGAIEKGLPKTIPYVAESLAPVLPPDNPSAAKVANTIRGIRGKVIHGGRLQDRLLRREVDDCLGQLQSSVALAARGESRCAHAASSSGVSQVDPMLAG